MPFFGKPFLGALVKLSTALLTQNVTSATAIAWDAETYDYGAWHDTVTANTKLIVPAGVSRVRVSASVTLTLAGAADTTTLKITKNGGNFDGQALTKLVAGDTSPSLTHSTAIVEVVAGDYFEVTLQVSADTSITISTPSWFSIQAV